MFENKNAFFKNRVLILKILYLPKNGIEINDYQLAGEFTSPVYVLVSCTPPTAEEEAAYIQAMTNRPSKAIISTQNEYLKKF